MLDAFIVTLVSCPGDIGDNGRDTIDGQPQKMCHDSIADALPKAYRQFIDKVCQYVKVWALTDLKCSFISVVAEEAAYSELFGQEGTVQVLYPASRVVL